MNLILPKSVKNTKANWQMSLRTIRRITRQAEDNPVTYLSSCEFYALSWSIQPIERKATLNLHWFTWHSCFRRLSMRPTQEELEERNILKSKLQTQLTFCKISVFVNWNWNYVLTCCGWNGRILDAIFWT